MWHMWGRRDINTEFLWGYLKENDLLEDQGIDGRIILNASQRRRMGWCGLYSSSSGMGQVAGSCEHVNKSFGSMELVT